MKKGVAQMESDTTSIEQLLNAIESVRQKWIPKHKVNVALGKQLNVFSLCGIDHYETWHSRILAEFLNPKGKHGQNVKFLKLFEQRFLQNPGIHFSENARVSTEVTSYIKTIRIGRFDILIEDEKTRSVCIIENKIFAEEQTEQLSRYATWLENERNGWHTCLVFLTLDGHESSTIKKGQGYIRLAYYTGGDSNSKPQLIDWIEDCSNSVKEIPRLCYTLVQYINHVKNLATGEKAMSNEIIPLMTKRIDAARLIHEYYQAACVELAKEILMKQVREELEKSTTGKWSCDPRLRSSQKEEGVIFIPQESSSETEGPGHIFVYFNEPNLCQCEVALWQNYSKGEKNIDLEKLKSLNTFPDYMPDSWQYGTTHYPLWRGVAIAPENQTKNYGMNWDGSFFADEDQRNAVIKDIVQSIQALHDFQKSYGKSLH